MFLSDSSYEREQGDQSGRSFQFSSVHLIVKFHIIELQAKLITKIQNTHKTLQHTENNKYSELLYEGNFLKEELSQ